MAPAVTSDLFWTIRPSPHRRPSRFELILGFCGGKLAAPFLLDIPKPVAAFSKPALTIFGATFTAFELVETIVRFYLNWLVCGCFLAKK